MQEQEQEQEQEQGLQAGAGLSKRCRLQEQVCRCMQAGEDVYDGADAGAWCM